MGFRRCRPIGGQRSHHHPPTPTNLDHIDIDNNINGINSVCRCYFLRFFQTILEPYSSLSMFRTFVVSIYLVNRSLSLWICPWLCLCRRLCLYICLCQCQCVWLCLRRCIGQTSLMAKIKKAGIKSDKGIRKRRVTCNNYKKKRLLYYTHLLINRQAPKHSTATQPRMHCF